MIEAMMMGGLLPGPWSNWEFIGSANQLAGGSAPVEASFPAGVRVDDFVVALMSPLSEGVQTNMGEAGWQRWTPGGQDYVCTARYAPGLPPPTYTRSRTSPIFVSVLVFRAAGWSQVRLVSHVSPAAPINVTTKMQNELLLAIGVTPKTTRSWEVSMYGAEPIARVERINAPALQVYSASIDYPRQIAGISVDASSGAERNLILTVS